MGVPGGKKRVQSQEEKARNRAKMGFAALNKSERKEVASKGGKAAHAKGTAHKFLKGDEKTREAGRKSGLAVSQNREHMSKIGKTGGENRGKNRSRRIDQKSEYLQDYLDRHGHYPGK